MSIFDVVLYERGRFGPSEPPLRGEASNHRVRHWLKTVVVSDTEKAHVMRQVGTGKTTAAETSKWFQMTSKPGRLTLLRDKPGGCPLFFLMVRRLPRSRQRSSSAA